MKGSAGTFHNRLSVLTLAITPRAAPKPSLSWNGLARAVRPIFSFLNLRSGGLSITRNSRAIFMQHIVRFGKMNIVSFLVCLGEERFCPKRPQEHFALRATLLSRSQHSLLENFCKYPSIK